MGSQKMNETNIFKGLYKIVQIILLFLINNSKTIDQL